jgi:hypothetical protein
MSDDIVVNAYACGRGESFLTVGPSGLHTWALLTERITDDGQSKNTIYSECKTDVLVCMQLGANSGADVDYIITANPEGVRLLTVTTEHEVLDVTEFGLDDFKTKEAIKFKGFAASTNCFAIATDTTVFILSLIDKTIFRLVGTDRWNINAICVCTSGFMCATDGGLYHIKTYTDSTKIYGVCRLLLVSHLASRRFTDVVQLVRTGDIATVSGAPSIWTYTKDLNRWDECAFDGRDSLETTFVCPTSAAFNGIVTAGATTGQVVVWDCKTKKPASTGTIHKEARVTSLLLYKNDDTDNITVLLTCIGESPIIHTWKVSTVDK